MSTLYNLKMAQCNEQQMIFKLREMLLAEKDLLPCTEETFLLKFLRTCDFDCPKALQLILNYYKLPVNYPDMYKNLSSFSQPIRTLFEQNFFMLLPQRDQYNRSVMALQISKWDARRTTMNDLSIAVHLCSELMIEDIETQINGFVCIIELSNIRFQHLKLFDPNSIVKFLNLVEKSFPAWFHQFHFVNINTIFRMIYAALKPVLSRQFREKMFFHTTPESLHEYISPNILPVEFGGNGQVIFDSSTTLRNLEMRENELTRLKRFGFRSIVNENQKYN